MFTECLPYRKLVATKMAGRRNSKYENERRARLAMLESDSSLRSGLRRCLSLRRASAHSHPRTVSADQVPRWAAASEIDVIDLTNDDDEEMPWSPGVYIDEAHCLQRHKNPLVPFLRDINAWFNVRPKMEKNNSTSRFSHRPR